MVTHDLKASPVVKSSQHKKAKKQGQYNQHQAPMIVQHTTPNKNNKTPQKANNNKSPSVSQQQQAPSPKQAFQTPNKKQQQHQTPQKFNNNNKKPSRNSVRKNSQGDHHQYYQQDQYHKSPLTNSASVPSMQNRYSPTIVGRGSSTPSPKTFAGSSCFKPPTPESLPKPPMGWQQTTSSSGSGGSVLADLGGRPDVHSLNLKPVLFAADPAGASMHLKALLKVQ
jgi:membrane-bound lytic murein transglycosylase